MWLFPRTIAHRGGGTLAPENTLAAMQCGVAHGYRAVEFDVMLSSDGVPVLMHDPQFGRTVPGRGKVCETTASQLAAMDAGSWFSHQFAGEPVPTFEQVVGFCKENGVWMNVEIKPAPGFEVQTGHIVGEWTRRLFAGEIAAQESGNLQIQLPLFSSFSFDALLAAKETAPEIPRGFLADALGPNWREQLDTLGALAMHTNHRHLTKAQAQMVKDAGFGLFCYTVNDPVRARTLLDWGVDAFCTDRIDLIGPNFAGHA